MRAAFPGSTLADLYDPLSMPLILVKAHNELDKAVESAYCSHRFVNDAIKMVFKFELYERYLGGMFLSEQKGKTQIDKQE